LELLFHSGVTLSRKMRHEVSSKGHKEGETVYSVNRIRNNECIVSC
jgi:hypothetical protein